MKTRKVALAAVGVVVGLLVLAEGAIRLSGMTDIPLYRPDPHYGYIPQASQSGLWRNRNAWAFNALSMGVEEEFKPGGVLLIGDSIVSGGNQTDQAERVGPQLENLIGQDVWPISAGSWALLNELAWLRENPTVVRNVNRFVFILNDEDFKEPSVWRPASMNNAHIHPSRLYYLFDRQLLLPMRPAPPPPTTGRDWRKEFAEFRAGVDKPILVVLFSGRTDRRDTIERYAEQFGTQVLVVKHDPRWKAATFKDQLHLDAAGNAILARLIAEQLR